ncbi:hypothetical protein SBRY_100143 [Actinacidiphila bryophytorum]|uniref:Uncharacterized protein n=1 Tax=Actinacidiphila bryophytorum TaxID=1436133 RepID=A0A9W4GX01_9ACTN|nr:hypothetical protein SBRY_100143 [Actinacidiphila bryophytorum]
MSARFRCGRRSGRTGRVQNPKVHGGRRQNETVTPTVMSASSCSVLCGSLFTTTFSMLPLPSVVRIDRHARHSCSRAPRREPRGGIRLAPVPLPRNP